jgi:hypothetical protein
MQILALQEAIDHIGEIGPPETVTRRIALLPEQMVNCRCVRPAARPTHLTDSGPMSIVEEKAATDYPESPKELRFSPEDPPVERANDGAVFSEMRRLKKVGYAQTGKNTNITNNSKYLSKIRLRNTKSGLG